MAVPALRLERLNHLATNLNGRFVLYWMTAHRRMSWNYALDHALDRAVALSRPLLVVEALGTRYRWASDRFHRFILEGMSANRAACADAPLTYACWLGRGGQDEGAADFTALVADAAEVILDGLPGFHQIGLNRALSARCPVAVTAVDAGGIFPLRAMTGVKERAVDFRRVLQKSLAPHLFEPPRAQPFAGVRLPALAWRPAWDTDPADLQLANLPIDHGVGPVALRGGTTAARERLTTFLDRSLNRYATDRNEVEDGPASGLSPWLHFGHLAAWEVVAAVFAREDWDPGRLVGRPVTASKSGWWGLSPGAEALLDQIITWRDLGAHYCHHVPDYADYGTLPAWARATLAKHALDPRPHRYSHAELERAATHDPIWNAAQNELVRTGVMHNYLRMLWAKKILEWSPSPEQALASMIELNNRWALDGRDANSYTGIMWSLGRFDRPWGPERPIFGLIRYMSSDCTRRKLDLARYLKTFATPAGQTTIW